LSAYSCVSTLPAFFASSQACCKAPACSSGDLAPFMTSWKPVYIAWVKLVEEPDVLAPTPAAARGAQERRASEPHAAEPKKIFAAYTSRHLPFPYPREASLHRGLPCRVIATLVTLPPIIFREGSSVPTMVASTARRVVLIPEHPADNIAIIIIATKAGYCGGGRRAVTAAHGHESAARARSLTLLQGRV
jgi:hypothetical protein